MAGAEDILTTEEQRIFDEYCTNHFTSYHPEPEEDLSFLTFWRAFIDSLKNEGAQQAVNTLLLPKLPLTLNNPEGITSTLYKAAAGTIPIIFVSDTADFENLVTNLVHKGNRPQNISATGSSFIYGKKTRFILLSQKPYSNVSAATMGLAPEDWQKKSMQIRLEHECTHFFTKKYYGTARNHLHDELIADFFGITNAFGFYSSEYFELFMGIKGTEGSRLSYYIPDCSPALLETLKETASRAARCLEKLSHTEEFCSLTHTEKIRRLCETPLLQLSENDTTF